MSRPIATRLCIQGRLVAESPLHVGGLPDDLETDMPLARDGQGRLYVPGTSLAGPLRAWMTENFHDRLDLLNALWGCQPEDSDDGGSASRVLIEDGLVSLPSGLDEELWDGVGIDRESGAAAQDLKYDRTVLPRGTSIALDLKVELPTCPDDAPRTRAAIGHLLGALEAGEVRLGAAGTRGLGRIRLDGATVREEDWCTRAGVLAVLRGDRGPALAPAALRAAADRLRPRRPRVLRLTVDWHPEGPLMTRAGYDGIAVDMLPMVSGGGDGRLAMVLPGSGIKGALRGQAERIVRTVLGRFDLPPAGAGRRRHLQQLAVPLVEHLFGAARPVDSSQRTEGIAGRGLLSVATVYATAGQAHPGRWQAVAEAAADPVEGVKDPQTRALFQALGGAGLLRDGTATASAPHLEQAHHVAVDRWTGGAAEGLLFSALEPFAVPWEPLVLRCELDSRRLPVDLRRPALALLLLCLCDLARGRVPLGFGVNRGYGSLAVDRIRFELEGRADGPDPDPDPDPDWAWLQGQSLVSPFDLGALPATEVAGLRHAWCGWIDEQAPMRGAAHA